MRVLVYPHSMELGGSQLNAVELAGAVVARGHEVLVFSEDGPLVRRLDALGVQHVLARRPRVRPSPTLLAQLCRTVLEHRVDVVHGYEWPPALEAVCGPQLRLGVPAVATVMSMSVAPFVPRALPLAVGTTQIFAAERAHRPRLTLLEPPVDTVANAPGGRAAARAGLGLAEDDFVVVVVSRLAVELKREGLLGGSSTGTLLAAALRHCRAQTTPKRVVTFVCDTGTRYLSKVYNDSWMFDQGLLHRATVGDLRDLISRRVVDEAVISVSPDDTLLTAFQRMRAADISQVPVLQDGKLAGLLDESDLLLHVSGDSERFRQPVRQAMNRQIRTLRPDAGLQALIKTLQEGWVAVVADGQGFHGLITRFDLLNYLRKTLA